jgi:hypothetical protein
MLVNIGIVLEDNPIGLMMDLVVDVFGMDFLLLVEVVVMLLTELILYM